ncbi:SDR family NAD(P)-dependent oxidoreductase [Mycolicibacterium sp. XJ1819]
MAATSGSEAAAGTDPDPLLDLTGRVAVVTGGGTGIGARTAQLLASRGADVVLAGRTRETLARNADEIRRLTGRDALVVPTDVRDPASVEALLDATATKFNALHILVNNAGGAYMHALKDTPPDRWRNAVELNLDSAYLCMRAALPYLAAARGAIVNISSAAGVLGVKGGAAYAAAKAGLQMLTRVTAAEWGPKGVRCNAIAVGSVASEGALRSWARFGATPESMAREIPLRRVGWPDDIAYGVLFFVSPMSAWISGQTLSIDGGPRIPAALDDEAL